MAAIQSFAWLRNQPLTDYAFIYSNLASFAATTAGWVGTRMCALAGLASSRVHRL